MPFVFAQEVTAGRKIVVYYVKNLAFDSGFDSRQHRRVRAVVDVRERDAVRSAHVGKKTKGVNSHPACDALFAGTKDRSGPNDDVRDAEPCAVLHDEFVLFYLRKSVGIAGCAGLLFYGGVFVQQILLSVVIDRKGAYVDKASQPRILQACIQEIARRDHRIQKRTWKGFIRSHRQM